MQAFMKSNQISLAFETSAKENINIANTFEEIAKQIFVGYLSKRRYSEVAIPKTGRLSQELSGEEKKKCC